MKTIFTFLCLGFLFLASAQNTFKTRVFPTDYNYLSKAAQLTDGSIVSVGEIGNDDDGLWLVKTSAAGVVLASKRITTTGYDEGYSVTKTSDGGFAVAGIINDATGLLKFNADLSVQWEQVYDISRGNGSGALKVIQTADGGYLLSGYVSNALGGFAGSLVKTDSQGVIQFQKRYFDFFLSAIIDLSPTTDGNYAFLAVASSDGNNLDKSYVGKVRPDGSLVWTEQYSDVDYTSLALTSVIGTSDGGVAASGYVAINGTGDGEYQMVMVKLDANGNLNWSKKLQTTVGGSEAYAVREDKDGGYLFAGDGDDETNSFGYVVKTTSAGALVWKKTFEPDSEAYTEFTDLIAASDGGFVVAGDGYLPETTGDLADGGIIYEFSSSFDACGETAGTADGFLQDVGAAAGITLTATNATLAGVAVNDIDISDVDEVVANVCSSLPVHLTSFAAALQGKTVNVTWKTASEVNTDYFVVERSARGTSFDALQKIAAKGNSSVTQSYSINDLQPLPGTSYYRLKEVDKDGKVTYSSVVPVTLLSNGTIVISPNPVQNYIRVIVQSTANSNLTLQVVDMKGNVLAAQTKAVGAGRNEINIPASSLAKGVYVLKVMDRKTTQAIRFVKE